MVYPYRIIFLSIIFFISLDMLWIYYTIERYHFDDKLEKLELKKGLHLEMFKQSVPIHITNTTITVSDVQFVRSESSFFVFLTSGSNSELSSFEIPKVEIFSLSQIDPQLSIHQTSLCNKHETKQLLKLETSLNNFVISCNISRMFRHQLESSEFGLVFLNFSNLFFVKLDLRTINLWILSYVFSLLIIKVTN